MMSGSIQFNNIYIQNTSLNSKDPVQLLHWWNKISTAQKRRITSSLDVGRITKGVLYELSLDRLPTQSNKTSAHTYKYVHEQVAKLSSNKDFLAGCGTLFIAQLGAKLRPEWHPTAAVLLSLDIVGQCSRYGKVAVIAKCANQLVYRSGYLDEGDKFDLSIASVFVPVAVREMEHALCYDFVFGVWSLGSLVCLLLGMGYSIVSNPAFSVLTSVVLLVLFLWLVSVAFSSRQRQRRANLSYALVSLWALHVAWNAHRLMLLKFIGALLVLFPSETLEFRCKISRPEHSFKEQMYFLKQQFGSLRFFRLLVVAFFYGVLIFAKSAQAVRWPGIAPKLESFVMLVPLLVPLPTFCYGKNARRDRYSSFGFGLKCILHASLHGLSLFILLVRSCCICCRGLPKL